MFCRGSGSSGTPPGVTQCSMKVTQQEVGPDCPSSGQGLILGSYSVRGSGEAGSGLTPAGRTLSRGPRETSCFIILLIKWPWVLQMATRTTGSRPWLQSWMRAGILDQDGDLVPTASQGEGRRWHGRGGEGILFGFGGVEWNSCIF